MLPEPVRLHIVTLGHDRPKHDPAACTRMVCGEPECVAQNGCREPQGYGNAQAGLKAA